MNEKISKAKANYRTGRSQRQCGNCSMFRRATNSCTLVTGSIAAGAVCDYWEKRK